MAKNGEADECIQNGVPVFKAFFEKLWRRGLRVRNVESCDNSKRDMRGEMNPGTI